MDVQRLVLVSALLLAATVGAAQNFVQLSLPKGVSVELPSNWQALSGNSRTTLDAAVQAITERFKVNPQASDLPFAANLYDDNGKTVGIFNIRYYPKLELTQVDARAAVDADVRDLDEILRKSVTKEIAAAFNNRILNWIGTRKQTINGATAFITEYRRQREGDSPFHVYLVRYFNGPKSFTVTVSYRENLEVLLRPIALRVIGSIRI